MECKWCPLCGGGGGGGGRGGRMGVQTSHGSSPLQQRAEESHGMSAMLTESFGVTCFLCRVFQDLAVFACLMCSAFSAVRPHCMVNDTSSRKLGDFCQKAPETLTCQSRERRHTYRTVRLSVPKPRKQVGSKRLDVDTLITEPDFSQGSVYQYSPKSSDQQRANFK